MCDTCGCGTPGNPVKISRPGQETRDDHDHGHHHDHHHDHDHPYSHDHEPRSRA